MLLSPTRVVPTAFDLSSIINNAMRLNREIDYISAINELQNSDKESSQLSSPGSESSSRKRARGSLMNPANTLDGLVVKRADDSCEPYTKRYLAEHEAIDGPDEEEEMRRMETDPDVSTRTCSACGYKGKWVSEMVRHKRVHLEGRPFKCRFCNRTSKWKADLIRHIAKMHGIRVLTKNSRSKTFDPSASLLQNRPDDDKPRVFACDKERQSSASPALHASSPHKRPQSYRCSLCFFEQDRLSMIIAHVRNAHDSEPYECRCGESFDSIEAAFSHPKNASCSDLIAKITPIYNRDHAKTNSLGSSSPDGSCSESSPETSVNTTEMEDDDSQKRCEVCPFESNSEMELIDHERGHTTSEDLSYKCTFCKWQSTSRSSMDAHLRLHALYPAQFLPATEQPLLKSPLAGIVSPNLTPSVLDVAATLFQFQSQMNPAYLASMNALLNLTAPSAFTPVLPLHACSRCNARFRDSATLATHLEHHGSTATNRCLLCDYACQRTSNFVRHVQTHHATGAMAVVESLPEEAEPSSDEMVDVEL